MRKICSDSFYGLNYIGIKEKLRVMKMLNNKSLFRYDGVKMCYESEKVENRLKAIFKQDMLLVNNGTSALKLCLIANDIGYGDEVLVPCLTFISTAASCLSVGAIPVFVEIDDTLNVDVNDIEKKITSKTKAIIVVHYQGFSCDMKNVLKIANKYKLKVIEDTAQAFGATYNNKLLGTLGDSSAFSFQACKIITCGEGGAFTSKKNFKDCVRYADNGGDRPFDSYPSWDKDYVSYGENFKITDLQSAILNCQLNKLDKILLRQQKKYNYLINNLNGYHVRKIIPNSKPVYMSLCIIFKDDKECKKFMEYTNKHGISFETKVGNFLPDYNTFKNNKSWHSSGYPYKDYKVNKCLNSRKIIERSAFLPLNSKLSKRELKYIVKVLNNYGGR